ncbi:hypothetical protein OZX57_08135 [Bifidobacterium sp. ESL0682]|uniref:hypothetical protein n=1 Tax=Bifidobacterium sp. ESL0682 TaxID=2983212 RepID=UPI0023F95B1C|nr:hypothetical protein [Bifidobacterium sp. ESL0682]WEV41891.1 hypothetical protein OZX57_08135 [Bifidobacterium sp. ESL0682]
MLGGNVAWGDESIRKQDGGPSRYLIGVSICDLDESEVRSEFMKAGLFKTKKVHWHDMALKEQKKSISLINGFNLRHIVVSAEPLLDNMRSERARRKCLETLFPILEDQYDIKQLIMEARSSKQNKDELLLIQKLRSRGFLHSLQYNLLPGPQDARLWIPDQVLGSVGAIGIKYPSVDNVEFFKINL